SVRTDLAQQFQAVLREDEVSPGIEGGDFARQRGELLTRLHAAGLREIVRRDFWGMLSAYQGPLLRLSQRLADLPSGEMDALCYSPQREWGGHGTPANPDQRLPELPAYRKVREGKGDLG